MFQYEVWNIVLNFDKEIYICFVHLVYYYVNTDNKVEKNDCNPLNTEPSTKDIEPEKSEKETHENENLLNEIKDLKDQLLRSLAENENLRKRTSKDIEQIKKFGIFHLLESCFLLLIIWIEQLKLLIMIKKKLKKAHSI